MAIPKQDSLYIYIYIKREREQWLKVYGCQILGQLVDAYMMEAEKQPSSKKSNSRLQVIFMIFLLVWGTIQFAPRWHCLCI